MKISVPEAIKAANLKRELLRSAGDNITRFRATKDGIYLFNAFTNWRKATADDRKNKKEKIIKTLEDEAGVSTVESPRLSWRLQSLREWSYEEITEVFP